MPLGSLTPCEDHSFRIGSEVQRRTRSLERAQGGPKFPKYRSKKPGEGAFCRLSTPSRQLARGISRIGLDCAPPHVNWRWEKEIAGAKVAPPGRFVAGF